MGRGRNNQPRNDPETGFTKQDLLDAAGPTGEYPGLSAKSFDSIRKAARVNGPGHGGLNWVFSLQDVITLIKRAESGTFTERGAPAAVAWRALLAERGVHLEPAIPKTPPARTNRRG